MADAVAIFSPGQRLNGPDGVPLISGYAKVYNSQTSDPILVYSDSDLTAVIGDTVYLSAGLPVAAFGSNTPILAYTGTAKFKVILHDNSGAPYASYDGVPGAVVAGAGGGGGSGITQDQGDVRYTRNANALTAAGTILDVDILPFWDIAGSANKGLTFANLKTKLTTDFRLDGRMMPVGTRMSFQQTTPPTGWTKETGAAYNDATLRFTTGTVATSGTASFNTVFASRTFTGTVGNDTPSITKTAAHTHDTSFSDGGGIGYTIGGEPGRITSATNGTANALTTGSGGVHSHTLTMNAADFDVKRVEMCIGIKA